jgi:hypothetical protein
VSLDVQKLLAEAGVSSTAGERTSTEFPASPAELPTHVSAADAIGAAYARGGNWLVSYIGAQLDAAHMAGMQPEAGFDPLDPAKYDLTGYGQDARRFINATSRAQADYIKGRIDSERDAEHTLLEAGPWTAAGANLIATLGPETLVNPGSGILRGAARLGAVELPAAIAREALTPHADSFERVLSDTAMSAAWGGTLGGLLRGKEALGDWIAKRPDIAEPVAAYNAATKAAEEASAPPIDPASAAAEPRPRGVSMSTEEAGFVPESTAGAQQRPGANLWGPDDSKLASAFGTEKIGTTAFMRLANSAIDSVRDVAFAIADSGLFQRGNFLGKASEQAVEARIGANWNGRLHDVLEGTLQDYLAHRGVQDTGKSPLYELAKLKLSDAAESFRGNQAGASYKEFKAMVTDALENGDRHFIPEVENAARRYRALVDELKDEATKLQLWSQPLVREVERLEELQARSTDPQQVKTLQTRIQELRDEITRLDAHGPNPGGSETWFKRKWLHGEVRSRRAELEARLDQFISSTPQLANSGLDGATAVDAILSRKPFRQVVEDPSPAKSSVRERGLDWIPTTLVTDFLERDSEALLRSYHREMAVDIELTRRFGSWDLHDTIEHLRGEGASEAAIEDVRTLRDFLRSTAGWHDPDSILTHAGHLARMYANVVNLGGTTITAVMDVARPVMTEGISRVFKDGIKPFFDGTGAALYGLAKRNAIDAGVGGEILLWLRTHGQAGVDPFLSADSKFMQAAEKAHSMYFLANLIAPWTDMMKAWTTMIVSGRIRDTVEAIAKGTAVDAGDMARLLRAGIDEHWARRIHDQFEQHGVFITNPRTMQATKSRQPNLSAWTDKEARDVFAAAIHSDVNKAIVTPGIADKATWMEKGVAVNGKTWLPAPIAQTVSQYYAFAIASTQKMMVSGLQQRDAAFLSGIMATVGLAHIVNRIRDDLNEVNGRKNGPPRSTGQHLYEAIDRSGVLGYFGNLSNSLERVSGNTVGLRPWLGVSELGAGLGNAPRHVSGLGPTGGTLSNLWKLTYGGGDARTSWQTASAIRKLLPLQNVFYLDHLFDQIQGKTYEALRN